MTHDLKALLELVDKVFIVTSGEYSDYGITGVFLNKKDAEKCCRIMQGRYDEYRIEEWPLRVAQPRYYTWFCRIKKDTGEIVSVESWGASLDNRKGFDAHGNYYAMGETRELAVKNAQDYRTFELAKDIR